MNTTTTTDHTVTWGDLKSGDVIICYDGATERVIGNPTRQPSNHVGVRTNRHDHTVSAAKPVSLVKIEHDH